MQIMCEEAQKGKRPKVSEIAEIAETGKWD
jgi:hypothetical protein